MQSRVIQGFECVSKIGSFGFACVSLCGRGKTKCANVVCKRIFIFLSGGKKLNHEA